MKRQEARISAVPLARRVRVLMEEAGGKQTPGLKITEQSQQVGNSANAGLMTPNAKGLNQHRTGKGGTLAGWSRSHYWSSAQSSSHEHPNVEVRGRPNETLDAEKKS